MKVLIDNNSQEVITIDSVTTEMYGLALNKESTHLKDIYILNDLNCFVSLTGKTDLTTTIEDMPFSEYDIYIYEDAREYRVALFNAVNNAHV